MKKFRYLLLLPVIITAVIYYYSCDDTGVNPNAFRQGQITITLTNFKQLNSVDGLYQLWIVFDTSAEFIRNIGSFNINQNGNIVDPSTGDPKSFGLYADTIYASYAKYCFVTVGTDIGNQNNPHLIAGTFAHYDDSVGTDLAVNDPNAVGPELDPVVGNGFAWYILNQPTTNNAACSSGVWYCDNSGNPYLPMGALNPGNSRWIYEGWAADTSNPSSPIYYSTGRFYDPYSVDLDGAGPCAATGSFYNKPGQDWVNNFPEGCPGTLNLTSGRFQVFITIEPANEQGSALSSPFFVKLFWQSHVDVSVGCGTRDNLFNQSLYGRIPKGHINILK